MASNLAAANTIDIELEVNAIELYGLSNELPDPEKKIYCKISDPISKGIPVYKDFETLVEPKDTIIWQVKVDANSKKAGYSANITRIRADDTKLLVKSDLPANNGVVKGTVKGSYTKEPATSYKFFFDLVLKGVKNPFDIDPKLKGTKVVVIIDPPD